MAAACVFVDTIGFDFGRLTLYLPFAPCSMKNLFSLPAAPAPADGLPRSAASSLPATPRTAEPVTKPTLSRLIPIH